MASRMMTATIDGQTLQAPERWVRSYRAGRSGATVEEAVRCFVTLSKFWANSVSQSVIDAPKVVVELD